MSLGEGILKTLGLASWDFFLSFLSEKPDTSKEYSKQVLKSVFLSQDKKQSFSSGYFIRR